MQAIACQWKEFYMTCGLSPTLHLELPILHNWAEKKNQTWHFIFKNSRNGMGLIKTIMEEYSGWTWNKI
jgi:hypothetical protein